MKVKLKWYWECTHRAHFGRGLHKLYMFPAMTLVMAIDCFMWGIREFRPWRHKLNNKTIR